MEDEVICHSGKCEYKDKNFLEDECAECDIVEEIEHELLKKSAKIE